VPFGTYPTPVEPLPRLSGPGCALWVKRDDLTSPIYGGNKVRKLERLLPEAQRKGVGRVLTVGAVGSHHVLATAVFARQVGLAVEAVLAPQPRTDHVVDDLRADLALGVTVLPAYSYAHAALRVAARWGRGRAFIPVGGSNVLGALGYVDAARELATQVRAGAMPEPDIVIVTLGSGGTAGGLAAGFALARMKTRVLAVLVAEPPSVVARAARRLMAQCMRHEGDAASSTTVAARLEVDPRWLGRGYGFSTPEGDRAMHVAGQNGLILDPTYTAKTFAAVLDAVETRRAPTILYWHTLSSAPLAPLLTGAPREEDLAPALRKLLR
jgi:1-aminocyclopropane-1-carboxylate deaminase/D-cysteine desulfhydrase-like pyridoxal-dependent ACC family enzyme